MLFLLLGAKSNMFELISIFSLLHVIATVPAISLCDIKVWHQIMSSTTESLNMSWIFECKHVSCVSVLLLFVVCVSGTKLYFLLVSAEIKKGLMKPSQFRMEKNRTCESAFFFSLKNMTRFRRNDLVPVVLLIHPLSNLWRCSLSFSLGRVSSYICQ